MSYGPPLSSQAKRIMLLGSGELGKEVVIEAQRLGIETIAVDRYPNAPAMQVAHHSQVIDMTNPEALSKLILEQQPDLVVPEIEAIATGALVELEKQGVRVVPTANAARLTMDREGIRRLAAEDLKVPTAKYAFANSLDEFREAIGNIGLPCVVKPLMSSSGKGQSVCHSISDAEKAWEYATTSGRVKNTRVIVEEFIHFESEITLLTVRTASGTLFCPPIGHIQKDGDYIESWQPHGMSAAQLIAAQDIARTVTDALGGYGVFGVELFLAKDTVYFSEVSPRPHDTGLVTLVSQNLSEFALHVRAILGLPIPEIELVTPGASHAIKARSAAKPYRVEGLEKALSLPRTQVRIFGKPETTVGRRMAVVLCGAESIETARATAHQAAGFLEIMPL
ncbi:formate-dependent phosphoribosylglycinamide formyltransferase [Alicyclobacillus tolerans]|uniref:formate-dependent phosphoribosylglycinamide formyltransferase n=1 Tax=Alicyclobacillus tolerans TaxID=90970 RepID=UPI001F016631|nr:formate-dependent phosphoribosylglycinamide formyltransferase [Alicyclobacillus tolerans]MCF8563414.1 formate-dependent phosphoribosylglycinamide formyltransferase [Alicyclobacillus tolerans]